MKIRFSVLGQELLAVAVDWPPAGPVPRVVPLPAPEPGPAPEPTPEGEPEPAEHELAEPEPVIPAGFGFHGGSGGSTERAWSPRVDPPTVVDRADQAGPR